MPNPLTNPNLSLHQRIQAQAQAQNPLPQVSLASSPKVLPSRTLLPSKSLLPPSGKNKPKSLEGWALEKLSNPKVRNLIGSIAKDTSGWSLATGGAALALGADPYTAIPLGVGSALWEAWKGGDPRVLGPEAEPYLRALGLQGGSPEKTLKRAAQAGALGGMLSPEGWAGVKQVIPEATSKLLFEPVKAAGKLWDKASLPAQKAAEEFSATLPKPLRFLANADYRWKVFNENVGTPIAKIPFLPRYIGSGLNPIVKALGGNTLRDLFIHPTERMPKMAANLAARRELDGRVIGEALDKASVRIKNIQDLDGRKAVINLLKSNFNSKLVENTPPEHLETALNALKPITDALESYKKSIGGAYRRVLDAKMSKGLEQLFSNTSGQSVELAKALVQARPDQPWSKTFSTLLKDSQVPNDFKSSIRDLYNLEAITHGEVAKKIANSMDQVLYSQLIKTPGILSPVSQPGYIQGTRGAFKNLWVEKNTQDQLDLMYSVPTKFRVWWNKWMMTPWKLFRVIDRVPTQFRNAFSILVQNDVFGEHSLSPLRVDKYIQAAEDIKAGNSKFRRFAKRAGLEGVTWVNAEMKPYEKIVRNSNHPLTKSLEMAMQYTSQPFLKVFNNIEAWGKYTKFLHNLDHGMSNKEAIADSMRATFDYSKLTKATSLLKDTIMPFATWQMKVARNLPEAMVRRPLGMAKYWILPTLLTKYSLDKLKITEPEFQQMKKTLPDYVKNGWYMVLPYRDEKNRLQLYNLTWLIPGLGDIADLHANVSLKDPFQTANYFMQNPFLNLYSDLRQGTTFSGAPIANEWDDPSTKTAKYLGHIWSNVGPAWLPGGTDWRTVSRAFTQPKSKYSLTPGQAAASQFGLKVTPVDPNNAMSVYVNHQVRLLGELKSVYKRELLSGENREDAAKRFKEGYLNILENLKALQIRGKAK